MLGAMTLPGAEAVASSLRAAYAGITTVVAGLGERDLLRPTACHGWLVTDLLLHVTGDAQRALVALASPADGPADVDFVTYWRDFAAAEPNAAVAHTQWVRRSAAAYAHPSGVVQRWSEVAPAAARLAARTDPHTFVRTQGHVMSVPDFLATLVTEAAVHHLDLIADLPGAPPPVPGSLAIARATLDGLAAPAGLPAHWDSPTALRKGTGRLPLDDTDRQALGERAAAFPLLS